MKSLESKLSGSWLAEWPKFSGYRDPSSANRPWSICGTKTRFFWKTTQQVSSLVVNLPEGEKTDTSRELKRINGGCIKYYKLLRLSGLNLVLLPYL